MADTSAQLVVEQMKQYIDTHLHEPISLFHLVKHVGYSMYHVAHLFKDEASLTPVEYIRKQRLVASAHALRKQDKRIIDIAFDHQFASHEGYTRAYSKAFGSIPNVSLSYLNRMIG